MQQLIEYEMELFGSSSVNLKDYIQNVLGESMSQTEMQRKALERLAGNSIGEQTTCANCILL
jgi:hypothetical protein